MCWKGNRYGASEHRSAIATATYKIAPETRMAKKVVVVGGGLAGMVAARELRTAGLDVEILEASHRLGGKAGAEHVPQADKFVDHGYHVFPPWYANTLRLLDDLGIGGNLIGLHSFYYVRRPSDSGPRWVQFRDRESLTNLVWNTFHGIAPWPDMLLTFFALFQLANEPFRYRSALDRTSLTGFLRAQPFVTESIANLEHHTVLQGSSIAAYEVSAMTMQRVARAWFRTPSPFYSIMNGDLHNRFIRPFQERLESLGVSIRLEQPIAGIDLAGNRVTSLRLADGSTVGTPDTIYVLAVPHEVAVRFVDPPLFAAEAAPAAVATGEKALSDFYNLRSAAMASFHLALKRKIHLRDEHIVLYKSRFLTSFIDLRAHWKLPTSELSIIASDFSALQTLADDDPSPPVVGPIDTPAARPVIDELLEYMPEIQRADIDESRSFSLFNVRRPLFLNTVGAWPFRPRAKSRLANLYMAGDYCQTAADITTMESAVISGLDTAKAILADEHMPDTVEIESLKNDEGWDPRVSYPRIPLRLVEYLVMPPIAALFVLWALWKAITGQDGNEDG